LIIIDEYDLANKMKTKKILVILVFIVIMSSIINAFSGKGEYLEVVNNRNKEVLIEWTYWEEKDDFWRYETIFNIALLIDDALLGKINTLIKPKQKWSFLSYFPTSGPLYRDSEGKSMVERLAEIPFMDKLKAIYKELRFLSADGELLASLETLDETSFTTEIIAGGTVYILTFD
jgi:hypothetical protein